MLPLVMWLASIQGDSLGVLHGGQRYLMCLGCSRLWVRLIVRPGSAAKQRQAFVVTDKGLHITRPSVHAVSWA